MILEPAKTKRGIYITLKIWVVGFVGFLAYLMTIPQEFGFKGKIDECCCEAELVLGTNQQIYQMLDDLSVIAIILLILFISFLAHLRRGCLLVCLICIQHTKFFRTFKVNIDTECSFFSVEGHCLYQSCSVCRCDSENIPVQWQKTDLIKQANVDVTNWHNDTVTKEQDGWQWRVEEFENTEGVHVDLKENVEAYTGYQGQNIWKLIQEENCFQGENLCVEQRALNRVLSGLHTSVNTQLSELYIDFEVNRKKMYPNWKMYFEKVGDYPDRIKNLHFYYTVLLRAINKASNVIRDYNFTTGDTASDFKAKQLVNQILDITTVECDHPFQEESLFQLEGKKELKRHYQNYIHNITRIMDCVECEKCKVFGKMQVYGIGVALKILFSDDSSENIQLLQRNELITLVNAFIKSASSLDVVNKMFQRRFKAISSIGYAIFGTSFFFMMFLLFAMSFQEKYLGEKVKRMFRSFPTNIPDPDKKRNQLIAKQQEQARKEIFSDKKND